MKKDLFEKYKITDFIQKIKSDLSDYGGKLILKTKASKFNSFDGEFSESEMIIKCFIDHSSTYWIGVLAHEYAHFLQCINENKLWVNFQNAVFENVNDLETAFHKNGKKISKKLRKKIASCVIKMELDCDKTTIKLINKYKLPVDKKEYCSKANIILYKYLYWGEYGVWPELILNKDDKNENYFKSLRVSKLMSQEKYKSVDDIPIRLLGIFKLC
jgi:hypothetical protein